MAVQEAYQAPTQAPIEKLHHSDEAAKWFLTTALVGLVVFGTFGLITAIKFVFPGLFNGVSWLAWPRIRPTHVQGVIFGWLVPVAYSMFFYMIPRLCGTTLYSEKLGKIACVIWTIGVIIGSCSLLNFAGGDHAAGTLNLWLMTKGKEYEDYDVVSNIFLTAGVLLVAVNTFRTIAARRYRQIYVALWYAMATVMWTALVYVIGNWPGQAIESTFGIKAAFSGTNDANVNWFYGHSIVGLVATPGAIALAYYFIPKSANAPLYSHKLSIIGFWTLGAIYFWNGGHHLIYGPIPYWLQTIATIFSFLLFIPVTSAVINFLGTVRGEWHQLRYNVPLKFFVSGTIMYFLVSSQGSFMALRQVSGTVHFTDHTIGHSHLALFGFATMFSYGAILYAAPRMWRRPLYSEGIAEWSFWLSMLGVIIYVISMTISGFYQGILWQNPNIPFIDTVEAMVPFWHARMGGGIMMVIGMVLMAFNIYKTATSPAPAAELTPLASGAKPVASAN
jgi:cytochrome c oxidase cbb3-type subunit 1